MSYADLRDFEAEATFDIPAHGDDSAPLEIAIEKLGGGTVGRTYDGTWRYIVSRDQLHELAKGQYFKWEQRLTHESAGAIILDMLLNSADSPCEALQPHRARLESWLSQTSVCEECHRAEDKCVCCSDCLTPMVDGECVKCNTCEDCEQSIDDCECEKTDDE